MNRTVLKYSILLLPFMSLSAAAVSSSIAAMNASFPGAGITQVMSVVTIPSIFIIMFSLFAGRIASWTGKKQALFLGFGLILVGGAVPWFLQDLNAILVLRGVLGAGIGLLLPLSNVYIIDHFDGADREGVFGLQSTFVSMGGMATSFLAGSLGGISWRYAFLIYLLAVPLMIMTFFLIPKGSGEQEKAGSSLVVNRRFIVLSMGGFLLFLTVYAFFTNLSIVISDAHLGGTVEAGTGMTLFSATGILAGLVFRKLVVILRRFMAAAIMLFMGGAFLMIALGGQLWVMLLASGMIGFGFAIFVPYWFLLVNASVPVEASVNANAIFISVSNIGGFVSPYVFTSIARLFGQGAGTFPILLSAVVMLAWGFAALAAGLVKKKS